MARRIFRGLWFPVRFTVISASYTRRDDGELWQATLHHPGNVQEHASDWIINGWGTPCPFEVGQTFEGELHSVPEKEP